MMDLTINTAKAGIANAAQSAAQAEGAEGAEKKSARFPSRELRMTECGDGAADDFAVAAAAIPPEAFSRDDELGRMIHDVFSLPAPPMPDFE